MTTTVYCNYEKNQILILDKYVDQNLLEVATTRLYHKGKLLKQETIILALICLCRWFVGS